MTRSDSSTPFSSLQESTDLETITSRLQHCLLSPQDKKSVKKSLSSIEFKYDNGTLHLYFPHSILKKWFLENKRDSLNSAIQQYPFITGVEYSVLSSSSKKSRPKLVQHGTLIPRHTFDNFITNAKNEFPLTLCQAIASRQETDFNLLILYGKNGRGKTHLLEAVLNEMGGTANSGFFGTISELNALYSRLKRDRFCETVSQYAFLLIDDLHEIMDFPDLQQELAILIDTFVSRQKQLVFSTSVAPNDFTGMQPQLKSRLVGGLIVSLKKPDIDIKLRFVQRENKRRDLNLEEEQMFYLVRHFDDFRTLEGSLLKISAYKQFITQKPTASQFESIVSGLSDTAQTPDAEKIISAVCEHYQVNAEDIRSSKRKKEIAGARQVAMYLCRTHLGLSFPALGSMFGNKDHTTALYSVRKIEHRAKNEPELKKELARIYAAAKN